MPVLCRDESAVPIKAGPGRLVPETAQARAQAHAQTRGTVPEPAVWSLNLPEPLKDRKKRCTLNYALIFF